MVQITPRGEPFSRFQPLDPSCFPGGSAVQRQQPLPADGMQSQSQQFSFERYNNSDMNEPVRINPAADLANRRPMTVQTKMREALRDGCEIPAQDFFVAAVSDDGHPITFFTAGRNKLSESVIRQFFNPHKFHQVMNRIASGGDPILDDYASDGMARNRAPDRRRSSAVDWQSPARAVTRKRQRPRTQHNDGDDLRLAVKSRKGLRIGASDPVWEFYQQRFRNCQQTACKLIAKAWVKAVEPKKQSTHPYTGSDEKAPEWWPKPWGTTKDDKVRHKEPDHLYKRERVYLLAHILRLVIAPVEEQHPDIKKLGLNVSKLEETTTEALSSFFVESESNMNKRPYLNEIFQVARQEERYRNGEIDESTMVYVMSDDKVADGFASDDEGSFIKDEDDVDMSGRQSKTQSSGTSAQGGSKTVVSPVTNIPPGNSYMSELPVRASSFQPPMMRDMGQQHAFVDSSIQLQPQNAVPSNPNALTLEIVTSPHDSRRPSVFSDFGSPGGTMYQQTWQTGANAQDGSTVYSYSGQQTPLEASSFVSHGVSMNPSPSFMAPSFDETSRSAYDQGSNSIFRPQDMNADYSFVPDDGVQRHPMHRQQHLG